MMYFPGGGTPLYRTGVELDGLSELAPTPRLFGVSKCRPWCVFVFIQCASGCVLVHAALSYRPPCFLSREGRMNTSDKRCQTSSLS